MYGLGEGKHSQALGWAESQRDPENLRKPPAPVEPALYHRGSATVAGGDGARDRTTQPPRLDWVAPEMAC